jgi:hypothetical protein
MTASARSGSTARNNASLAPLDDDAPLDDRPVAPDDDA